MTRRALALGAALAPAAPAAGQARDIHATDSSGNLLGFDSRTPGVILDSTPLTGLPSGVSLAGIDVRPATTTLYGIDSATGQLVTQNPPNDGTLVDGKPLGIDVGGQTSFEISGAANLGFLATTPPGGTGAIFSRVDLATGRATILGPIGTGSLLRTRGTPRLAITGIAARQEVAAPRANVPPTVKIVKTTLEPRPGQRAAYIAQAADPDGAIAKVEWDSDADGVFDDATSSSLRLGLPAGVHTLAVRVTDDSGARTTGTARVPVAR